MVALAATYSGKEKDSNPPSWNKWRIAWIFCSWSKHTCNWEKQKIYSMNQNKTTSKQYHIWASARRNFFLFILPHHQSIFIKSKVAEYFAHRNTHTELTRTSFGHISCRILRLISFFFLPKRMWNVFRELICVEKSFILPIVRFEINKERSINHSN